MTLLCKYHTATFAKLEYRKWSHSHTHTHSHTHSIFLYLALNRLEVSTIAGTMIPTIPVSLADEIGTAASSIHIIVFKRCSE